MKKVLGKSLLILSMAFICVSLLFAGGSQVFGVAKASEQFSGTFLVSDYETGTKIINFAPMNKNNERMNGTSWVPDLVDGGNGVKLLNDKIDVSGFFDEFDVGDNEQSQLALQAWLYFVLHTMTDLTIGFSSEDGSKYIEWHIDEDELFNILQKDFDNYQYDIMFYSANNVPWGWNLMTLPFTTATASTDGLIVDGTDVGQKVLDLTYFYVRQDNDSILPLGLNVYSLTIKKAVNNTIGCDEKQAFCVVELNELQDITQSLYIGEYYTLPSIFDVFKSLWIGDVNLLSNNFRNEQYYKVEVSSNGTTTDEYYGKAILLENNEYDVCFLAGKGNGDYVALKRLRLKVQSYGTGAWFDDDEVTVNIDEMYELKYHIHPVFKDAVIEFVADDDKVIEIVEVDNVKQVVKVKGLKKGESGITIKVYDDRLMNSDNEDGLENNNLLVKVQKETNKTSTVKVMLWISLVVLLGIAVYNIVLAIKKHKNFEVK